MRIWKSFLFMLLASSFTEATNIPFTDANIRCFGWGVSGSSMTPTAVDAPCYFSFFGTALSVNMGSSDTMNWKIDSTTFTTTGPGIQTVTSGLSSSTHTVYMYGTQSTTLINTANAFQITGSTTVVRTDFGTQYDIGTAPFTTYGKVQGCPLFQNVQGFPNGFGITRSNEVVVDYYATGAYQSFLSWNAPFMGNPDIYALYSDGVQIATITANTTGGQFQLYTATATDSGQHHYELLQYGLGTYNAIPYIMPSSSLSTVVVSSKPCVSLFGDSIVGLTQFASPPFDGRLAWWEATNQTGFAIQRQGESGARLVPDAGSSTSQITGTGPQKSSIMILEFGVNDVFNWTNSQSTATYAVAISTILTTIANGDANIQKFLVQEILPSSVVPSGGSGLYALYRTAQANGVAAYNASTQTVKACFYHTTNWIDPTTDTVGDGLHPSYSNPTASNVPYGAPLVGYGKISNRLAPILQGYGSAGASFSVSGPPTGAVGVTSSNFRLDLGARAAFTGDQTITISDGGMGGTFAGAHSSGANPIVFTPLQDDGSISFTYTPASSGTIHFTYTNAQDCWTNATPTAFIVGAQFYDQQISGQVKISGGVKFQ